MQLHFFQHDSYWDQTDLTRFVEALEMNSSVFSPLDLNEFSRRFALKVSVYLPTLSSANSGFLWVRFRDGATVRTSLRTALTHRQYDLALLHGSFANLGSTFCCCGTRRPVFHSGQHCHARPNGQSVFFPQISGGASNCSTFHRYCRSETQLICAARQRQEEA